MRYLLLFLFVFPINSLYAQVSSSLKFNERVFNFGEIQEKDGEVAYTFTFLNTGKKPIVIGKVISGCSCVTFNYDNNPVLPDQEGKIKATYNPAYRPGFFSKEIRIYTNAPDKIHRVWVKGTVIPCQHPVAEDYPYDFGAGLHLNLKVLSFGKIKRGTQKEILLRYANDTPSKMTLRFVSKGANLIFPNPGILSPQKRGELRVIYQMPSLVSGEIDETVEVWVNGQKLSQPLPVKAVGF